MFESIINFFKNIGKKEQDQVKSKDAAKERLHLVLMQDRANVSADFLDLMKQEIIEVIKKYIDVDENAIDVRLTNKANGDGTTGAPALYANIPIVSIKEEVKSKMARQNTSKENEKKDVKNETSNVKEEKEEKEEQVKPEEDTKKEEIVKPEENKNEEVNSEGKEEIKKEVQEDNTKQEENKQYEKIEEITEEKEQNKEENK